MTPELWGELLGACNPSQRHTRLRTKALVDLMNDYTDAFCERDTALARAEKAEARCAELVAGEQNALALGGSYAAKYKAERDEARRERDEARERSAVNAGNALVAIEAKQKAERERDALVRWLDLRGQDAANRIPFDVYAAAKRRDLPALLAALGESND